jgi:hypothetical protein
VVRRPVLRAAGGTVHGSPQGRPTPGGFDRESGTNGSSRREPRPASRSGFRRRDDTREPVTLTARSRPLTGSQARQTVGPAPPHVAARMLRRYSQLNARPTRSSRSSPEGVACSLSSPAHRGPTRRTPVRCADARHGPTTDSVPGPAGSHDSSRATASAAPHRVHPIPSG